MTSVKLPEQLAYLARTVLPRDTVANNIGIFAAAIDVSSKVGLHDSVNSIWYK